MPKRAFLIANNNNKEENKYINVYFLQPLTYRLLHNKLYHRIQHTRISLTAKFYFPKGYILARNYLSMNCSSKVITYQAQLLRYFLDCLGLIAPVICRACHIKFSRKIYTFRKAKIDYSLIDRLHWKK